ncbi:MAG: 16S rRNA (guanine(966)-N(2))-methyltransferase RsmD [Candidatus Electrothrix sp. AR4]|nr:16S rRNA (guanine(966)-N(2))-methyltransferase RsmD [Candidatus Electrothrix sp. AR4]
MRITGGLSKGHTLISPKSGCRFIRPTSDRVREALFNILAQAISGSTVLDLYAGTGALGIEALSRGAAEAVFIDQSRQALELIHSNLSTCFPTAKASLLQLNLSQRDSLQRLKKRIPSGQLFDLIFLDPPYEKKLAEKSLRMVEKGALVQRDGLVIAEERKDQRLPEQCGTLTLTSQRNYGETGIWLYRNTDQQHTMSTEDSQVTP